MSDKKFSDLTDDQKERLKQQYLEGASLSDLSNRYGIARTSLSYHANKKWKQELELQRAELFSHFSKSKKANFIKMSESAIKVMTRALEDMADRDIPPTIREAKDATVILESLDKITRLDDGNPTEIVAEKPISITEIKAKLKLDPFYEENEIEEIEFKEVDEES
jgi:transposase-like protein